MDSVLLRKCDTAALGMMSARSCTGVISGEEEADYYPFGGERVFCDRLPDQHYKFTGKELDSESTQERGGRDRSTLPWNA